MARNSFLACVIVTTSFSSVQYALVILWIGVKIDSFVMVMGCRNRRECPSRKVPKRMASFYAIPSRLLGHRAL